MPTCDLAQQVFAALPLTGSDTLPAKFLAVPGDGQPRWFLPMGCRNVDSVLSTWSPYRASSRLKWGAIRAANRVGAAQLLPNSSATTVVSAAAIDWRSIGWHSKAPPTPIVYVGTPGISRKAVIHLVDVASGQCRTILKVPLEAAAKRAILREADMLAALAAEKYVCAPRLLHVDRQRGIATQTFIAGTPGDRRFGAECCRLLQNLMLQDETTTIAQHAAALQEQPLWTDSFELHPGILQAILSELSDTRLLPACWVHGDFAPWNIKRPPGQRSVLIDWEEAERGGLPLHDYYHFLHIQDYLFGERPSVHSPAGEPFAATMGITATQCRKLEIAYLASSYLKSMARQEHAHADFLLKTIAIALQARPRPIVVSTKHANDLPKAPRHAVDQSRQIRAQLFAATIAQFNSAGIRYCVLGGYDNDTGEAGSDVDLMVHPRDMQQVPAVLIQSARSAGASLVQAIQHETTGCYFVLAKYDGRQTGFLDPDCCSDYRRAGRLWLPAGAVIAGRRRYQDFYVPAVPDEFLYYLVKKVLKQSVTAHQLKCLQHLYARNPPECRRRLTRFWPQSTALQIQRALVEQNLAWFELHMQPLLLQLKKSAPVERGMDRCAAELRDRVRVLQRVIHPTGMSVLVLGSETALPSEIANGLLQNLAPAFRWTARATLANTVSSAVSLAAKIFWGRRRSTFIVTTATLEPPAKGLLQALRYLRSIVTRLLFRPDLVLVLESRSSDTTQVSDRHTANNPAALDPGTRTIHWKSNLSPEQITAEGTSIVLDWLGARLQRRRPEPGLSAPAFSNNSALSFDAVAEPVELRSAELD